jgi:hypothetical protein
MVSRCRAQITSENKQLGSYCSLFGIPRENDIAILSEIIDFRITFGIRGVCAGHQEVYMLITEKFFKNHSCCAFLQI